MGKRVVILVERDFQDMEVMYPFYRLKEAGHEVVVVGSGSAKEYKGKFGYPVVADKNMDEVSAKDFDAVVVPGGWAPDFMRRYPKMVQLVADMDKAKKPVAAICHAGWMLVSAKILKGRTVTCFSAIRDDVEAAGATWVDKEVCVDGNLITSRKPDDLPAFMRELLKQL